MACILLSGTLNFLVQATIRKTLLVLNKRPIGSHVEKGLNQTELVIPKARVVFERLNAFPTNCNAGFKVIPIIGSSVNVPTTCYDFTLIESIRSPLSLQASGQHL